MARTPLTDEEVLAQIPAARVRGRVAASTEPRAEEVFFDTTTERIVVELTNGCAFAFPPSLHPELREATPEQLAAVETEPGGEGLHWEELDVDISLPGLIARLLNIDAWAAKYLGARTSPAKAAAARINGQKGGRPRSDYARTGTLPKRGAKRGEEDPGREELKRQIEAAKIAKELQHVHTVPGAVAEMRAEAETASKTRPAAAGGE